MEKIFAPFGFSSELYNEKFQNSIEIMGYLKNLGLNGYEYSCEEGIHISDDGCEAIKTNAEENRISLSLYTGNLFLDYMGYFEDCIDVAQKIGAKRIVVPLGNCATVSRKTVFERTLSLFEKNTSDIYICPEIMGKIHDFGTLDEVLELCKYSEKYIPALSFPNLLGRNLKNEISYEEVNLIFDKIENILGKSRLENIHMYFSGFEFTNQGLKKYTDLSQFNIKPVLKAIDDRSLKPFIVCRSPNKEITDLLFLKNGGK